MTTIVTRASKGASLSWTEMDDNLTNLNIDKLETNGALGTPASGTLTNCTGLPVNTGVSGLGTGVATALEANAGAESGFQLYDADIPTVAASQVEMEAGTEVSLRSMSPLRVAQAISALSPAQPSAASQSDQETATSNTVFVTPGRQQLHPSSPKAWIVFNGTAGTTGASYGCTFSKTGTGDYTITFTTAFSSTSYAIIGTVDSAEGSDTGTRLLQINSRSVGSCVVKTTDTGPTPVDCAYVSLVFFGDQ